MTRESLGEEVGEAVYSLLGLVEKTCWNKIVPPFKYIITNITNYQAEDFASQRKIRNRLNRTKRPKHFGEIVRELETLYDNLYDINLFVYHAHENGTTIEIQYYPVCAVNSEQEGKHDPMLHVKVVHPYYREDESEKFDVNWEYLEGVD